MQLVPSTRGPCSSSWRAAPVGASTRSPIVAFVSYIAWFWLVKNYAPTRVSAFSFLSPVFGVLAGNILLGEAFTPSLAVALVLVAFGIYLVNRPQGPSR